MSQEAELEALLQRVDRAVSRAMSRESGETESGLGHSRAIVEIVSALNGAELTDDQIRVGRQQVNPRGGHYPNRPDIAYQAPDGTWVNIEVDTSPSSLARHRAEVTRRAGGQQHNIFLLVDRTTGGVIRREETGRPFPSGAPQLPVGRLAVGQIPRPAVPQPVRSVRRAPAARPVVRRPSRSRESEAPATP